MKKSILFAAAATIAFAGSANAQVCAGFPTMDGQFSVGGVAYFPEDIDQFGAEASYNLAGPLAVNVGYLRSSADGESLNTFSGGAAFDITSMIGPQPALVSLCPVASIGYTSEDEVSFTEIPVGIGFGANFPVSPAASVQPFVIPQIVFGKLSIDGAGDSDWENEFGLRGGANVVFGQFYVGAEVSKLFVDEDEGLESDAVFGVRAGIRI